MYTFDFHIRVRYAETDQMGFVYYGNYLTYYEVGRVEALRNLGITYKKLEEEGILMPVIENSSKYLAPALYDELLQVKVTIKELPQIKISFHYEFYNEASKLIHTGKTTLVFIDKTTNKPQRTPEKILSVLSPYFKDED